MRTGGRGLLKDISTSTASFSRKREPLFAGPAIVNGGSRFRGNDPGGNNQIKPNCNEAA